LLDLDFVIDKAHDHPNTPSKDGDLHIAGRNKQVGLPIVAEIMNAKFEDDAVTLVHNNEGKSGTVPVTGVWRIWCEHPGDDEQVQADNLKKFLSTNPDHVFEIHPVTRIKNVDLTGSLTDIKGFNYKDPADAFNRYNSTTCKIIPGDNTSTIVTRGVGYNYTEFNLEIQGTYETGPEGRILRINAYDFDNEILMRNIRAIVVKNSEAYKLLKKTKKTKFYRVVGIPRINMNEISKRIKKSAANVNVLEYNLPYEMIIVAVLK
jgi:hypothetical protein